MPGEVENNPTVLLPIESQDQFEFFIELTSTPKTTFIQPASSTPVKKPSSSQTNKSTYNRTSLRPRRTLKRTYCKSAIFFRQLKRTFFVNKLDDVNAVHIFS